VGPQGDRIVGKNDGKVRNVWDEKVEHLCSSMLEVETKTIFSS